MNCSSLPLFDSIDGPSLLQCATRLHHRAESGPGQRAVSHLRHSLSCFVSGPSCSSTSVDSKAGSSRITSGCLPAEPALKRRRTL